MRKARLSRRMLVSILALGAILAPILPGFLPVTPALAAGTCNSFLDNYFAGWVDYTDAGWGSSAYIVTHTPAFCTGTDPDPSNNITSAWSMIVDSKLNNYAQSGWLMAHSDSTPTIFSEYKYTGCPNGFCRSLSFQTTGGQTIQYWQSFETFRNREMWMGYSSYILDYPPYDPTDSNSGANYWPGPWYHEYFGETKNYQNDMPGTSTNPTSFTFIGYQPTVNTTGARPPAYYGITTHYGSSDKKSGTSQWCVVRTSGTSFNLYTASSCPAGTPN